MYNKNTDMGLFTDQKKKKTAVVSGKSKCCRCGRPVREHHKYFVIDGKLYCEKCGKSKKEWQFLELMDLLDD